MRSDDAPRRQQPNRMIPRRPRRPNPAPPAPPPAPDAGPRPLSAGQRALRENRLTPMDDTPRVAVHRRDASTTRVRVLLPNRRRRNWPRLLLGWASGVLAVECIAALLFSPRLAIRSVTVEGNTTVPTARVLALAGRIKGQNIVRLAAGRIRAGILREPTDERVTIRRDLPSGIRIVLQERQPWASVLLPDGACFTIDQHLVPFRKSSEPERGLPRLKLSVADDKPAPVVLLGKPMTAPGLAQVSACLAWAREEPDFHLDAVAIDPTGKLCLNREGEVQVQLGSETDLDKKLYALGLLLQQHPALRTTADIAYINLFAFDAPAVLPRKVASAARSSSDSSVRSPDLSDRASEQP
jgi:cell division protein FtsQ